MFSRTPFGKLLIGTTLLVSIFSCTQTPDYYPKPKGFNRIDLPARTYQPLAAGHPFSFEFSKAAIVQPDTFPGAEPHWLIVYYPSLEARIQLTYKPLYGNMAKLQSHINDAYKLASKHQVRAFSETEQVINLSDGRRAVEITIEGEVPSHHQFFITDTTRHFLRGAVYLKEASMNDSLRPIIEYMRADCRHLLKTLRWK